MTHIKVKELAKLFGMTVKELAEYTGYDRVNLYRIIEGNQRVNINRYNTMMRMLRDKAMLDYQAEKIAAYENYLGKIEAVEAISDKQQNNA